MAGLLVNLVNRLRARLTLREDASGTLQERVQRADAALKDFRFLEAEQIYRSVLRDHPLHARAQTNLAISLSGSGRTAEAVALLEQAVAEHPDFFDAWFNLAVIQHSLGRLDAAIAAYTEARRIMPASPEVRRNLASLRLFHGELTDPNWRDFAWRRLCEGFESTPFRCAAPLWKGEPLGAGSIVIHGEQGLGDEIMYASCYPRIESEAQRTLIACNDRLLALFRRSFARAEVIGLSEAQIGRAHV